jgi:hypothetical protein
MVSSPVPEPPEVALRPAADDGVAIATAGTLVFTVALVVCLLRRDDLAARGDQWWTLTCVAGVVVGVLFGTFASRRARAYSDQAHTSETTEHGPSGG